MKAMSPASTQAIVKAAVGVAIVSGPNGIERHGVHNCQNLLRKREATSGAPEAQPPLLPAGFERTELQIRTSKDACPRCREGF